MERFKNSAFFKALKSGDQKVKIIMIVGLIGIALIFLSQMLSPKKQDVNRSTSSPEMTTVSYRKMLEADLSAFISQIEGAGETKVMVTLKGSGETLYLKEQKTDMNQTGGEIGKDNFSEHRSVMEEYVVTDGKNGKSTVVKSQLEPEIKGVVVICAGGEDPLVEARILHAVTTALNLSSVKVYISKLSK